MHKALLVFAVALLLSGCDGIDYPYTYRVLLNDGTTTYLYSQARLLPGEKFKSDTFGSVRLQQTASGRILGTILNEVHD